MYAVSSHDKDPSRATGFNLQGEIDYCKRKLLEWKKAAPKAKIYYKEGNHETRLTRYLQSNAKALFGLEALEIPVLLNLKALGIEWVPNFKKKQIGKLWHLHGNEIGGSGQNVAHAKFRRTQANIIFGHHHTENKHTTRSYDGAVHGAWSNPCLCDLECEYMHHTHNWSHGFAVIEYHSNGNFQVDQIQILKTSSKGDKARCMVRGKLISL
jgi:hypothetical protein